MKIKEINKMLKFKKLGVGNYKAISERYIVRIEKQDISKEWILSIQDKQNRDCLTDTVYVTYNKKSHCIEHANNYINN
jgi:hypothetical protein